MYLILAMGRVSYKETPEGISIARGPLQIEQKYLDTELVDQEGRQLREVSILAIQGEQRLNMAELLPANWRIFEINTTTTPYNAHCNDHDKIIAYPQYVHVKQNGTRQKMPLPFLTRPYSMATMLHEVGHAQLPKEELTDEEREMKARMQIMSHFFGSVAGDVLQDGSYDRFVVEPEIQSDQFALRTILAHRLRGLDLEPGRTREQIVNFMLRMIQSYLPYFHPPLEEIRRRLDPPSEGGK